MSIYGTGVRDIDDESNLVRMRSDMYRCFDDRLFVVAPKSNGTETCFVVHSVSEEDRYAEFRAPYHNTALQSIGRVSREYVFARFAWCIFIRGKPFPLGGVPRRVVRFGLFEKSDPTSKTEVMGGSQLGDLFGAGKSRSSSPRKSKLGPPGDGSDAAADNDSCSATEVGSSGKLESNDA
ncbi:hypothetical protein B0T25DRAFT_629922 [Lasiosphaeria hispida]|uniref:HNH nuclease domain-containing protein n=1 Tax=Lasiosphaeria hispida TaxID=260671 RepID=A0AAJ0HKL2_9PEZI|nr:hypothetical protein B0T25DRAFT_629922 [Lasiosphaeria hispida]